MRQSHNQALGKRGEDLACRELRRRGYAILARRYRTRAAEIDIVARDGPTVVFIEVKARSNEAYGLPAESVRWHKQCRLGRAAVEYLLDHGLVGQPCRFDVVSITLGPSGQASIELLRAAFTVDAVQL